MKGSAAALAALLLLALCFSAVVSFSVDSSDGLPLTSCCSHYVSRPIRYKHVASIYATSSSCPKSAVILVNKKGRKMCADPQQFWVQVLLELFQSSSSPTRDDAEHIKTLVEESGALMPK